jgi:Tfp pilus assembly protein PilF
VLKPHALAASIVHGLQSEPATAEQTLREAERMVNEDPESYPANVALAMVYQMIGHPKASEQLASVQWLATRPR